MDCYVKRVNSRWIAFDSFDRSNGLLGSADSGQAWASANLNQWGVLSNLAVRTGGTSSNGESVVLDSGVANHTVEADLTLDSSDVYVGLCFQSHVTTPSSLGWRFRCGASVCRISAVVAGTNYDYENASYTWNSGEKHHVKVKTRQSGGHLYIDCYIDDVLIVSRDETTYVYAASTGAGLYLRSSASAPLSTFDSIKITTTA